MTSLVMQTVPVEGGVKKRRVSRGCAPPEDGIVVSENEKPSTIPVEGFVPTVKPWAPADPPSPLVTGTGWPASSSKLNWKPATG